jgi:galactonate dehydratase
VKITGFETFVVQPRWVFLKVETDTGIVGWGEPNLEGKHEAVLGALADIEDHLVGADPRRIEHHWQSIYRGSFYHRGAVLNSALAGVDQALWDIRGKDLGVPVHELLGGPTRDRIRAYAPVVGDDSPERLDGCPETLADRAVERVEAGFDAVKLVPLADPWPVESPAALGAIEDRVRAVREAVGPTVDVAIDLHGKPALPTARRLLRRLEPYEPLFVEEPVKPEYDHRLDEFRSAATTPIATGERRFSRWDFRDVVDSVDVVQPDASHAGGISELRRIASLAETHGVQCAFHCPLGPVALASCVQVDAAIPNFLIQETPGFYGGEFDRYAEEGLEFDAETGSLRIPDRPGLGVTLDEDDLRASTNQGHDQYIPHRTYDDGSVADW